MKPISAERLGWEITGADESGPVLFNTKDTKNTKGAKGRLWRDLPIATRKPL